MRFSVLVLLVAACLGSFAQTARAQIVTAETIASTVSVLPVWPGQPQGGASVRPGAAPEGSGVVVADGVVATAWHVIEPATRIDVRLADGRILPAQVVAHDVATDIALLSVDAGLRPLETVTDAEISEPVCAIGNAFGLGLSVTCGVLSAEGISNAGFNPVEDFLQTDAAVNPGMSGGALVNADGQLVGMVSAIFASEADANVGVNFAVSSELLTRVTEALLSEGAFRVPSPGWRLGVPDRATQARVAAPAILDLDPSGAAATAGLRPGDLVLRIAERDVQTPRDAIAALAVLSAATPAVDLLIDRDGQAISVALDLSGTDEATTAEVLGECPHPEAVCERRQAVFPVSSFDPVGSATRIAADLLVTSRHVVGDRADAIVHTPNGPRGAQVVPSAYTGDLILLQVSGLPEDGIILDLAERPIDGSPFFAIGADVTRGEVRVFEPGALISGPAPGAPLGRLHVAAVMQPGVSGGALLTADGGLAGIAAGGGEGRFEAIPVSDVLRLLELRDDPQASEVTKTLGAAFAACADLIETARVSDISDAERGQLRDICFEADNHGQLLEAGRVVSRAGAFEDAIALHSAAVGQVPNSVNARMSLLVSLQLAARFEEMTDHARWLMEMASDDPQALRFSIQSGVWGGDLALAEAGYAALLTADPIQAQAARRFIDNAPPAPRPR